MNRRELIQLLGWVTTTVAASPAVNALDTDEQERLAGPSFRRAGSITWLSTTLRPCSVIADGKMTRSARVP
jgi:hypothetical protein